jgi:hypothetical protein
VEGHRQEREKQSERKTRKRARERQDKRKTREKDAKELGGGRNGDGGRGAGSSVQRRKPSA